MDNREFSALISAVGGRTVTVYVTVSTTITEIKQAIEPLLSIPLWQQRLLYNGHELDGNSSLEHLGIPSDCLTVSFSVIQCVRQKVYVIGGRCGGGGGHVDACASTFALNLNTMSWDMLPAMPQSREDPIPILVDGNLFSIGGRGEGESALSRVDMFDMNSESWIEAPPLAMACCDLGAVLLEGKLYAIGGHAGHTRGEDHEQVRGNVNVFHLSTRTWVPARPMLTPRAAFELVCVEGLLYVIGGLSGRLNIFERAAEVFDPRSGEWARLPDMGVGRTGFQAVDLEGKIYVMGGFFDSDFVATQHCEAFDPCTEMWSVLPPMLTARSNFRAVVLDGQIYVIGGETEAEESTSNVESLDPATMVWTSVSAMHAARHSFAVAVFNNNIYVAGGIFHQNPGLIETYISNVEVFEPMNNTWTVLPNMPMPRAQCAAFADHA